MVFFQITIHVKTFKLVFAIWNVSDILLSWERGFPTTNALFWSSIFNDVEIENLHVSVMGGPIFMANDPFYRNVQLPKQFWKIIYFRESGDEIIKAKGYVLTQADLLNELEALELPEFSVYEVSLEQIGEMTGLSFFAPASTERRAPEHINKPALRRIASVKNIVAEGG